MEREEVGKQGWSRLWGRRRGPCLTTQNQVAQCHPNPQDLHARPRVPSPTVWASVTWSGTNPAADGKKTAAMLDQIYGPTESQRKEESDNPSVFSPQSLQ